MAGRRVETQPTVPPTAAVDLPSGVLAERVVWDETIPARGYASARLARGVMVRVTDLAGDACVSLVVHDAVNPAERLNVADTVKVQWQAYLGAGAVLLSDMGRALATIGLDTSGCHDALCGASTRAHNAQRYGDGSASGPYPNARDQFVVALAKHGLTRRDVAPNVNLFKGVHVADGGALEFLPGAGAGTAVELTAEMELIVTVVNSPHPLDPRPGYVCTPLRVTAWLGQPTRRADAAWASTPERERAYLNTEHLLAGRRTPGTVAP
jgi:urea carboxylase-associated protein 2